MAIDKAEVVADTFELFFDLLSDQDKIADTQSPARSKFWYATEPDFIYSDSSTVETFKTSLPIGLIEVNLNKWSEFTLTKKYADIRIAIEWLTTSSENCDKYGDLIINTIETYRDTLVSNGLHNVNLVSSNKNVFYRGKIKVHVNRIEFEGRYYFTKTRT